MVDKLGKKEKEITVSTAGQVSDHGNDPYFVNKARQSKAFLDKHGFPKELLDKRRVEV